MGIDILRQSTRSGGPEKGLPRFVAIDFETADRHRDSACAVGIVRVEGTKITDSVVRLIKPPRRKFEFTYIHKITWPMVESEPNFRELWPDLAPYFEDIDFLAAHNATFDQKILKACCDSYSLAYPGLPFLCTVQLARKEFQIFPTKLPDVCKSLDIELNHHDALSDAHACAQIVIATLKKRFL